MSMEMSLANTAVSTMIIDECLSVKPERDRKLQIKI